MNLEINRRLYSPVKKMANEDSARNSANRTNLVGKFLYVPMTVASGMEASGPLEELPPCC